MFRTTHLNLGASRVAFPARRALGATSAHLAASTPRAPRNARVELPQGLRTAHVHVAAYQASRRAVGPLNAKGGGKSQPVEPEPELEGETELWSVALGITKEEVPAGTLAGAVIEDVRKIISKACPKLPTKKRMKELDMDDEQPLYVLTDGDEDQPFDPEESVVFAEMLFLSEDDCDVSVEAALEALEKAGYEAGIMDVDDEDEEYMEDDESEEKDA